MPQHPRNRRLIPAVTAAAVTLAMALASAPAHASTGAGHASSSPANQSPKKATSVLTQDAALKKAHATGKPVTIQGDETATSSLTANPNGTLTLTSYAQPVRKMLGGAWHPLDATLKKNPDGTVSPTVSAAPLTISGGGTGPLVTMRSGGQTMSLSLPVALPAPSLTGDTATYRDVIPGVDLAITATDQGGFSDVYTVHDAAAAANPNLTKLLTATTRTSGLHLSVDASGTVHADDARGREVFTAPAATMWDSATDATPTVPAGAPATITAKAAHTTGTASNSTAAGSRAHRARLGVHASGSTLTLTPDATLLSSKSLHYPVYLDPPWSAYSSGGWATVSENHPTQSYWNTSAETENLMQVGLSPDGFWADSLINFNIPTGELYTGGAPKFQSAYFYAYNHATDNLNTSVTDIYAPSATLNSGNATWNNWFTSSRNLGSAIGSANFAQNTSKAVAFPISTSWISESKSTQTIAMAGDSYSDEQSNGALYKVFDNPTVSSGTAAPSLALTFSHAPTLSDLHTSPNKSVIGDGNVSLNANVSDVDGGTLNVAFDAYITGHTNEVIKSGSESAGAGTSAAMWIYQPTLDADIVSSAFGNTSSTTSMSITWSVTVSNNNGQSATGSASFTYSTATPGEPGIYTSSGYSTACTDSTSGAAPTYAIGTPTTFYLKPSTSDIPATYIYQLNGGQPINAPVKSGTNGQTSITVTPTSQINILTVDAIGTNGNIGQAAQCDLDAVGAPNAAPGDLTGGPDPDLLVTGTGTSTLPSGLWLAPGTANGQINGDAVNIGINGNGQSVTNASATTFNGTQNITGLFGGSQFNDILSYNPTTGPSDEACSGQLIQTLGNGLPLDPDWSAPLSSPVFTLNGGTPSYQCATSVANGGNLYVAEAHDPSATQPATTVDPSIYTDAPFPDLLVIAGGNLYLEPTSNSFATYAGLNSAVLLSDTNPTGNGTWAGWSITTLNTTGDIPYMFAINQSTGAVYYYSTTELAGLVFNPVSPSGTFTVTPTEVATSGYGTSTYSQLQATTVNATPALWATTPTGATTTYKLNSTGTGLTASGNATTIATTSHAWSLNDNSTTAHDASATPLTLSGSGSVAVGSGDLFSPDIDFTTGTNGTMTTTQAGLNLTQSFTASFWAEPETNGTMALSQDGPNYPGLMVYPTPSGWEFYLAKDDGTATWDGDSITGGTAELGAWAHIQASYNNTTHVMNLYVNDTLVATGSHTAPTTGASGPLRLGANIDNKIPTSYYTGQIAQLNTEAGHAEAPTQLHTPASYHQAITPERILDTRQTGNNAYSNIAQTDTPLAANGTLTVPIIGDSVSPLDGGTLTTIPSTATAVAVDVTATQETNNGNLITYADGTQRPITSSTNYTISTTITGYQIVPIGLDGKIAIYNSSTGTTHLLVDLTGYFTSDASLAGDQTYHPLNPPPANAAVNTGLSLAGTSLTGTTPYVVPAGTAFTMNITGVDGVPANATGVAVNFTTLYETGGGYLEVYPTGTSPSADTALTYQTNYLTSISADVALGTGGTITIVPEESGTRIIAAISGYYTTDTSGEAYHTVNPTRLVDTRSGIGGTTGALGATGTYTLSAANTEQITTAANPTLALMVTETDNTGGGDFTVYPDGTTRPTTLDLSWTSGQTIANLALAPEGSDGAIDIYNDDTYTTYLVVDTSGYFANDAQYAPNHTWPLTDGSGATATDSAGTSNLNLTGNYTWSPTAVSVTPSSMQTVLGFDGTTADATTSASVVNTSGGFTISAWVNLTSLSTNATIAAQEGKENSGFYLWYNAGWNGFAFSFTSADSTSYTWNAAGSSTPPIANTWYHLVGTYDRASKTADLYINGALAAINTGITDWNATGPLIIGADKLAGSLENYLPGQISGIETFNYPLDAAQVTQLYQLTS